MRAGSIKTFECQLLRSLLDSTWKAIVTRDREKDGEENAEHNEQGNMTSGVQRFQVVQVAGYPVGEMS